MPVRGSRRETQVDIRVALHDIHVPKDVVVTTPEDFEWRKETVGTIEYPAVREGKDLYARQRASARHSNANGLRRRRAI
jgi:hypothetical protein